MSIYPLCSTCAGRHPGLRRVWSARPAKPPGYRTPVGTDARPRFSSTVSASHAGWSAINGIGGGDADLSVLLYVRGKAPRACVAVGPLDRQSRPGIEHRSERTPVRASPRLSPPRMRAGRRSTGSGEGMPIYPLRSTCAGKHPGLRRVWSARPAKPPGYRTPVGTDARPRFSSTVSASHAGWSAINGIGGGNVDLSALLHVRGKAPGAASRLVRSTGKAARVSNTGRNGRPSALLLDCLRLACGLVGDQRDRGRGCRSIRSAPRAREGTRGCVAFGPLDRQSRPGIEHRSERTPVRASPRLSTSRMRAGRRSTGGGGNVDLSAPLHVRGKAPGAASRLVRSTGKAARVSNTGRNGRPSALLLDCLRLACGLVGDGIGGGNVDLSALLHVRGKAPGACVAVGPLDRQSRPGVEHRPERTPVRASPQRAKPRTFSPGRSCNGTPNRQSRRGRFGRPVAPAQGGTSA